jgi:hypothetical protein
MFDNFFFSPKRLQMIPGEWCVVRCGNEQLGLCLPATSVSRGLRESWTSQKKCIFLFDCFWIFRTDFLSVFLHTNLVWEDRKKDEFTLWKWNHKTWPGKVEVRDFFLPKASTLTIKARHPILVHRAFLILQFIADHFYVTTSLLTSLQFLSVILSFERDFVFWAWFCLLSVILSFCLEFLRTKAWFCLLSVILTFERDLLIYAM